MKKLVIVAILFLLGCTPVYDTASDAIQDTDQNTVQNTTPEVKEILEENPPEINAPAQILEALPMKCANITNMSSSDPSKIGENAVIAITAGADQFKMGVYDLGYLYPDNLFRIARRGLRDPGTLAIKLKGPGSVRSEPMDMKFTCDENEYEVFLPAMTAQTVFYIDTYGRIYWRDEDHDGTGKTMPVSDALVDEHRYIQ